MADRTLEELLRRIVGGDHSAATCDAARAALSGTQLADALPLDDLFTDDPAGDAGQLLVMFEFEGDSLGALLRGAMSDGEPHQAPTEEPPEGLADDIMSALLGGDGPTLVSDRSGETPDEPPVELPVGDAVHTEAGASPEVASEHDDALPVEPAVRFEAGPAPEAGAAFEEGPAVGAAVVAEAGVAPEAAGEWADVPVQLALGAEAGRAPEIGAAFDPGVPVAAATHAEAGGVQAWSSVARSLQLAEGLPEGLLVAALTQRRAPEVWAAVAADAGQPAPLPLAEALADEAGEIDITDRVMASLMGPAVSTEPVAVPAPANQRRWSWALTATWAAMAAVFLLWLVPAGNGVDPVVPGGDRVVDMVGAEKPHEYRFDGVNADTVDRGMPIDMGGAVVIWAQEVEES